MAVKYGFYKNVLPKGSKQKNPVSCPHSLIRNYGHERVGGMPLNREVKEAFFDRQPSFHHYSLLISMIRALKGLKGGKGIWGV